MNTLNYIGCKHTLLEKITEIMESNIPNMGDKTFMDLFAGTGSVGFNMQDHFKSVSANDLETYSYIINYALLCCNYSSKIQSLIEDCNYLEFVEGLVYKNYSPNVDCERMFFTSDNAMKCDAIRVFIDEKFEKEEITENEKMFLIASLLVSIDKVANTSCVYGAYLKEFKKTALKALKMVPIHKRLVGTGLNQVFNKKAEDLVKQEKEGWDVLYLDPPYNQRQYAANYSPLNYIAEYNSDIGLKGKTGLIEDYNKSEFCSKVKVRAAFEELIKNSQCSYLLLSYNNEGLLDLESLKMILREKGDTRLYKIKYKRFKSSFKNESKESDSKETDSKEVDTNSVEEYLWVVDVLNKKEGAPGSFEEIVY